MDLHYENGMCPNVGDIVRWSQITEALTLADAEYETEPGVDPEESSEVIGVVERVEPNCDQGSGDKAKGTVVFFGRIDFAGNMPAGKQLTPGKVYYLTDSTEEETYGDPHSMHMYRNGSTQEPKRVSKPVYIATSPTTAVVTNFRGLMGGEPDYVSDEILAKSECTEYGFLVTVINTGPRPWKTPITSVNLELDPRNGDPNSIGTPNESMWIIPGTYASATGTGVSDDPGFILDDHVGILQPSEEKQIVIGTKEVPLIGKLTATFMSKDVPRAATSCECLPILSISSACGSGEKKPTFTVTIDPSSRNMISTINFNVLEKDSEGEYQILKVLDDNAQLTTEGYFQLPRETEDGVSYIYEIDIEDEYGSAATGEYKIQFPGVQSEHHWAWETLGHGATLSCITSECICEGGGDTHCFIFPHDEELRKTYGPPPSGAYELDGVTYRGPSLDNRNGYPALGPLDYDFVDGDYITKQAWLGVTSRLNNDGSGGRMCGTIVGTPEELQMAFSFIIPNDAGICFPKHTEDDLASGGGTPWSINIWKNRYMEEEEYASPIISMMFADKPKDKNKLITILLGYDDSTQTFTDCFSVPIDSGNYYIDEELNG
jgi:hypothetical protein